MKTLMVLAFFCYFLGMLKFFLHLAIRRKALFYLATAMIVLGVALHTAMLFALSAKTGHGPYTNSFEYTSFFAWTTMCALVVAIFIYRETSLGAFISPAGFLLMAYSLTLPQAAGPAVPVKAFWMTMHYTVSFLALSSFVVVFAVSIMYLIQERQLKRHIAGIWFKRIPDLDTLDNIFYKAMLFGFPAITVGVGSGLIWSASRFGSPFGPDPVKSFPMIFVWAIYAILAIGRSVFGWRGHRIAMLGTAGFACAIAALGIHLY